MSAYPYPECIEGGVWFLVTGTVGKPDGQLLCNISIWLVLDGARKSDVPELQARHVENYKESHRQIESC